MNENAPDMPLQKKSKLGEISVVIMDVDNTLFDWLGTWYSSFTTLFCDLIAATGTPGCQLETEIRRVHQEHRTSEYALLVEELPCVRSKHGKRALSRELQKIAIAYNEARWKGLRPYPGVLETLKRIKGHGSLIVAYSESLLQYVAKRFDHLGLDGLVTYVYSPPEHEIDLGIPPKTVSKYGLDARLSITEHRSIRNGVLKPEPEVLRQIILELGGSLKHTLYIGDSLFKDVEMAQKAGVIDVHAEYGDPQGTTPYKFLRRVSHWPDFQIQRDATSYRRNTLKPSYVANKFEDLLRFFKFVPFQPRRKGVDVTKP